VFSSECTNSTIVKSYISYEPIVTITILVLMGIQHDLNIMWSVRSLAYRGSTSDEIDEWKCIAVDNKFFKQMNVTSLNI